MKTELLLKYDDCKVECWKNALGEDCVSITDGNLTIKLLAVNLIHFVLQLKVKLAD